MPVRNRSVITMPNGGVVIMSAVKIPAARDDAAKIVRAGQRSASEETAAPKAPVINPICTLEVRNATCNGVSPHSRESCGATADALNHTLSARSSASAMRASAVQRLARSKVREQRFRAAAPHGAHRFFQCGELRVGANAAIGGAQFFARLLHRHGKLRRSADRI